MTGQWRWRHAALVAAARFVVAFTLAAAVRAVYRSGGGGGDWPWWLVVLAAATVAVALRLLREPIRALADHVMLGRRAGAYELMRDLLARMAVVLPVDEVLPRLAEATGAAAHSPRAEVRVFLPEGAQASEVWPPAARASGEPVTMAVQHAGDAVGEIEVEVPDAGASPSATRRLQELLGPAGVALSTVRLTYALRARLAALDALDAELRASRDRLLTARAAEQRRLQAEVNRRVLPPLDAAAASLRRSELAAAADQLGQALDAVRLIGRGIYPPRLADAGLGDSLSGWAAHADLAVRVRLDETGGLRSRPAVETGLYFWAVTALAALAGARDLTVTVEERDDSVRCLVTGLATHPPEDELEVALRDRAAALDGTLSVERCDGELRYAATIPLEQEVLTSAPIATGPRLASG